MELQTISQVSRFFSLSTRTLRYYEQIGLIQSQRKEGYAYRVYTQDMVKRLQQILILRKLRIPLRQIREILQNNDAKQMLEILLKNINDIDDEIRALETIRSFLEAFIERLNKSVSVRLPLETLGQDDLLKITDTLIVSKLKWKDEINMEELTLAENRIHTLTDRDVRILYLPPMTVAAYQYDGDFPERHVRDVVDTFVKDSRLVEIKPDLRHFGFNSPNPNTGRHGYEMWVTIPEDMEVPLPLTKKQFSGGMYGAYMIPMGAFEEWDWLMYWAAQGSERYIYDGGRDGNNTLHCLEEHLDYIHHVYLPDTEPPEMQLDLLIPVRNKQKG